MGRHAVKNYHRFREFVARFALLVSATGTDEKRILSEGGALLAELVSHDDWLPDEFAAASADSYRQYLLYCDPQVRFSVVSFVWGPGQQSPVHNHAVWGFGGMLRGAKWCREYAPPRPGRPMRITGEHRVERGQIDKLSSGSGDIHVVANALNDRPAVSIGVYGANIGALRRHIFDEATGVARPFVSGYHNSAMPDFWDGAAEFRIR
jgi:predicted metal-dependent enzyme (double-stranded beta helix superfamily)